MPDTVGPGTGPTEYSHQGARYGIQRHCPLRTRTASSKVKRSFFFHGPRDALVQEDFEVQLSVQGKTEEFLGLLCQSRCGQESISRCQRYALAESAARLSRSSNSVCMVSVDFFKPPPPFAFVWVKSHSLGIVHSQLSLIYFGSNFPHFYHFHYVV